MSLGKYLRNLEKFSNYYKTTASFEHYLKSFKFWINKEEQLCGEFRVQPEHVDTDGKLHTGLIFLIADNMSSGAYTYKHFEAGSSSSINVSYMSSAKVGDDVTIQAKVVNKIKNIVFVTMDLRNKLTNEIIARGDQRFVLSKSLN